MFIETPPTLLPGPGKMPFPSEPSAGCQEEGISSALAEDLITLAFTISYFLLYKLLKGHIPCHCEFMAQPPALSLTAE